MKTYLKKLKHILPVFLGIVFISVAGLTLLRWILCIQFSVLNIREEIWNMWIPLIFPWIPITLWLRQRLRVLVFKNDREKGSLFFQFIAWLTLTAMLLISQEYLTTATGRLRAITNIDQINKYKKARYYSIQKFAVLPSFRGGFTDVRTSGKYNEHLDFTTYFVVPIINDSLETTKAIPKNWYGIKFGRQISNRISDDKKEQAYEAFRKECLEKLKQYRYHDLDHFERTPASDDRVGFLKAIEARIKQPAAGDGFIILTPVRGAYEKRNGHKLAWIFGAFAIGLSVFLFALIWPGYSEKERKRFLSGKKPKHDDLVDMFRYLIPAGGHFATSIILDINILVYLLMVFSGINPVSANGYELLQWGANRRAEVLGGEWWRLFTSMFVHGGFMHLFLNIYGLVLGGMFVEPAFGRKGYFIIYVLSGLSGSLVSIWWYHNTISAGASGAIFGLYGAILGLLMTNAFPKEQKRGIFIMIGIYVAINLLWGLAGGIDNAAHIGGLISGALCGILIYKFKMKNNYDL
jgi:rhomboid protease GluP